MHASIKKYGTVAGKDLCCVTLSNDNGLRVDLLNYGAAIENVYAPDRNGALANVTLSLADVADYANPNEHVYLGKTVGRVAGRIRRGQWQAGAVTHQLTLNDGVNQMHSGFHGLDSLVFDFHTFTHDQVAGVTFNTIEWVHDQIPGNLSVKVTYTLDNENNLHDVISARSDAVTLFNPTNHVFWCLDGPHTTVEDNELMINSDYYLPLDAESMPAAGMKPVAGTVYDFRQGKRLGAVMTSRDPEIVQENGLNHPFIFNDQPKAVLTSHLTGRQLVLTTSNQAIIAYTANRFNDTGIYRGIKRHGGLALECQHAPSGNSDLSGIVILPGEQRSQWINWKLTTVK